MAPQPKEADWEAIEAAYRANVMSIRAIAAAHGVSDTAIRKRAAAEGWQRDLAEKVRRAVREEIVRKDGSQDSSQNGSQNERPRTIPDDVIVDAATRLGVDIVLSHRRDITQLNALKRMLADRLGQVMRGEQPDGPCLGFKENPSDMLTKLAQVTARLVPLERLAHNLDAEEKRKTTDDAMPVLEAMLRELADRRARLSGDLETPET